MDIDVWAVLDLIIGYCRSGAEQRDESADFAQRCLRELGV